MAKPKLDYAVRKRTIEAIESFCEYAALDITTYNQGGHWRIRGYEATLDLWPSTGRYYVLQTRYLDSSMKNHHLVERGLELGYLPTTKKAIYTFLHNLFFAVASKEMGSS